MLIYFILYGILIFMAYWCFQTDVFGKESTAKKAFCVIGCIAFILLMSLRHPVMGVDVIGSGGESIGYVGVYERIAKMSWERVLTTNIFNYTKGYSIFCKLLTMISKDAQLLIAVCAILHFICLFVLIYKTSKKPFLSTIMYIALPCFFIHFSGLRQSLAISITMIAFLMIKEKKLIKFILLVLLAWLFHSSAIVFLIAYPFYYLGQSSMWKLLSVVLIPITYIFRVPLFRVFSVIFKDNAEVQETGAITLFLVFTAIYIFLIVFLNKNNKVASGCTSLFWIACICQAMGGVYGTAMRVGYYFMIYAIIAIPEMLTDKEGSDVILSYKYKNFISIIFFIAFIGYALLTLYNGGEKSWYYTNPYRFFWE